MQAPTYDVQFLRSEALRSSSSSSRTRQIKECKIIRTLNTAYLNKNFKVTIIKQDNFGFTTFTHLKHPKTVQIQQQQQNVVHRDVSASALNPMGEWKHTTSAQKI